MKKLLIVLMAVVVSVTFIFAQVPQVISYQAIAFNSGGSPVTNGNVGVKISILDNSSTGDVVYSETHTKATNAQGLFNLNIGQGSPETGTFSSINWAANSKFLKVEIDPTGGTTYTNIGVNQLMSVPYALFADKVNTVDGSLKEDINESKYSNFAFYSNVMGMTYAYNQLTGTWVGVNGGSTNLISSNGNFAFYSNVIGKTYAFNKNTGTWVGINGGSTNLVGSNGNFAFYSNVMGMTYAFDKNTGTWVGVNGGSTNFLSSNGNFAFYSSVLGKTYAFNKNTGTWVGVDGGSTNLVGSNGNFAFYSNVMGMTYVFDQIKGTWVGQTGGSDIVISESN